MRRSRDVERLFEIVSFFIYDLGRSVDFGAARKALAAAGFPMDGAGAAAERTPRGRDTPASLSLPEPLRFPAENDGCRPLALARAEIKLYDDGALTIVVRDRGRFSLEDLAEAARRPIVGCGGTELNAAGWAARLFDLLGGPLRSAVVAPVPEERRDTVTYTAFCLLEAPGDLGAYIDRRRRALAALLIGESGEPRLHAAQEEEALSRPFSYRSDDLAVFDMDRCFIIEPRGDYEDILLIVEHANYRLLELRALDRLLDLRLAEAEKDVFGADGRGGRLRGGSPRKKFKRIQALRFEALFIHENLENSSKIIGDFYLCRMYDRLCGMFNTEGWKRSVERRLDILSSVYEMAKADSAQRRSLVLEIVFIAVCVILPLLQIWQALALD